MKKEDLFKLDVGNKYELTDGIYYYVMETVLTNDNRRMHIIYERGSFKTPNLCLFEDYGKDDYGLKRKSLKLLTAVMGGLGGIRLHSNDTYDILSRLKIINN